MCTNVVDITKPARVYTNVAPFLNWIKSYIVQSNQLQTINLKGGRVHKSRNVKYVFKHISSLWQTGGNGQLNYIKSVLIDIKYRNKIKLNIMIVEMLIDYLKKLRQQFESEKDDMIPIDLVTPVRTLLQYRVGIPTDADIQLIKYCLSIGLSQEITLSIYFAETKSDIVRLIRTNQSGVLMNILRLKKLSAYKKFLRDYQVQESQLGLLYSHRQLYI